MQPTQKDQIVSILKSALPQLQAVYLFGSRASGQHTINSDFDLAVLLPSPISASQRFELAQTLANTFNRDVDLVDLRSASTVLRSQVISTGTRLYTGAIIDTENFETFAFADYARLNEERADILADIRLRGSIHGK